MCNQETTGKGERGSSKREERAAERWCREWQRCENLRAGVYGQKNEKGKGITNLKAGPPEFLDVESKLRWEAIIMEAVRRCTYNIWLPFQTERLRQRWKELRTVLWDNINQGSNLDNERNSLDILAAVAKGIKNSSIQQGRREIERGRRNVAETAKQWIPPPPPSNRLNHKKEVGAGINTIKRGLQVAPVNSKFVTEEGKRGKKDPIELIARSIYGGGRRRNFVYRSIIKYMDMQEEKGEIFSSRYVRLKKGGGRKVNNYRQYRQFLYRQSSWVGKEEFRIIALLYQIQIRIFREGANKGGSNVICIDQIGCNYDRTVDLLDAQGEWKLVNAVQNGAVREEESRDTRALGVDKQATRGNTLGISSTREVEYTEKIAKKEKEYGAKQRPKPNKEGEAKGRNKREDIGQETDTRVEEEERGKEATVGRKDRKRRIEREEKQGKVNEANELEDSLMVESQSEVSSIELIDRATLEKCIKQKIWVDYGEEEQEKEVGNSAEEEERGKEVIAGRQEGEDMTVGEEKHSNSNKDNESEDSPMTESQSEVSSIELIDREMLERCVKQKIWVDYREGNLEPEKEESNSVEVEERGQGVIIGKMDRERNIASKEEHSNRKKDNELEDSQRVESQSEGSSIELLDRAKLERCIKQKTWVDYRERKEEEQSNGEGEIDIVRMRDEVGSEEEEVKSTDTRGGPSITTTSSIAELFRDKQLEREGKKIGRKNITRRKVWVRWKGVVRGEIRRGIRRKSKLNREEEKQSEDKKTIFDYTTKGLSVEEVKLLERGEAFCVADYKIDEDRSKVDIYQFQRRLRLHELFRDPGAREEGEKEEICTPVGRGGDRDSERHRGSLRNTQQSERQSVSKTHNTVGRMSTRSTVVRSNANEVGRGGQTRGRRVSIGLDSQIRPESIVRRRGGRGVLGAGNKTSREVREESIRTRVSTRSNVAISNAEERGSRRQAGGSSVSTAVDKQGADRTASTMGRGGGRVGSTPARGARRGSIRIRDRDNSITESKDMQEEKLEKGNRQEGDKQEREGRRLPSIYDPDSHNRNLNRYNVCIQEEIMLALEDKKVKFRDNVTKQERGALKSLKQRIDNKEIIITRADKGSGLVALDYDKYLLKGTKYIQEEAGAYNKVVELEQVIIGRLTRERNKIAEQLKERGVIGVQTATYIKKQLEEKLTGIKFYYKIHKDRQIDTMPLRPLQSCIKAPTQHLSIVLTDLLQPLLKDSNIPSFIFDSNQLLYRLEKLGKIPSNCTLISSDVSALYPSIPHVEGFRVMNSFLQEFTIFSTQQVSSIMKALELVITENYVQWNSQIYKQNSGVAMGTPVAVAYANIFMHWVDREVRKKATYIHEHIRYIDDNLFIIPGDKVEQLMEIANNILPPHIKFTYEKLTVGSGKGLPFLDTQLFIGEDCRIESRLYTKATDRHAYLLPSSYHPPHVTKNIPLAVFGRIRKICSREEWFGEDAQKAVGWLENRGYKKGVIQKALAKVRLKNRWEMIEKIEKNRETKMQNKEEGETKIDIPLILTYNQHVKKIRKVLKDRQPLLDSAFRRTKVRPRLSFRRKRNLNDIIVQKGLRGPIEENRVELNKFTKCREIPGYRSRCPCKGSHSQDICRCCTHSKESLDDIEYKLCKPVSCNSKNIIYIIGCNKCSRKYVGETQQRLKDRLAQHMYNVDKLNQPLYRHFRQVHKLENLYIGIVEAVKGVEPFLRKVREAWWINQLKTLEPSGFNVKLECNQVYEETG